jgi:uncharacterized protein DUF4150/HNH/endonuclease VII toxin of polymorphic toxin system
MTSTVYANDREISCKAADGKTICAFPDVCFTPPQTPATPPGVPLPYPNTGLASDTTDGTKTVKIGGKEVGIKNKSCFKKSSGDEAGCAPKKGIITSKNMGKVYFKSWSMDVKFEGENAVRHLDLTTNNHASETGDTPPWLYLDRMVHIMKIHCAADRKKEEEACKKYKPYGDEDPCPPETAAQISQASGASGVADAYSTKVLDGDAGKCLAARRCALSPYGQGETKPGKKKSCCPGQTPHHLVEASAFHDEGRGPHDGSVRLAGVPNYDENAAPCVCAEGGSGTGTHGMLHTFQTQQALAIAPTPGLKDINGTALPDSRQVKLHEAQTKGVEAFQKTFPEANCNPKCIYAQLRQYHEMECGMSPQTDVKAVEVFKEGKLPERLAKADRLAQVRAAAVNKTAGIGTAAF